jgi:hypothetical protein
VGTGVDPTLSVSASVTRSAGVSSPRALCIAWLILDEHGDTYDHGPPPPAAPPDPSASVGRFGCAFNRSGVRIPTLAISAWIPERTVFTDEHGATSLISRLRERRKPRPSPDTMSPPAAGARLYPLPAVKGDQSIYPLDK